MKRNIANNVSMELLSSTICIRNVNVYIEHRYQPVKENECSPKLDPVLIIDCATGKTVLSCNILKIISKYVAGKSPGVSQVASTDTFQKLKNHHLHNHKLCGATNAVTKNSFFGLVKVAYNRKSIRTHKFHELKSGHYWQEKLERKIG